jgi:hypothetical protein
MLLLDYIREKRRKKKQQGVYVAGEIKIQENLKFSYRKN